MFKFLVSLSLSLCIAASAQPALSSEPIKPTQAQSVTTIDILQKLEKRHYKDLAVNDGLSENFLKEYIEGLDPAKLYFYESDVNEFLKNKLNFDDFLRKGNLSPGFKIYHVYRERVTDRLNWVLDRIADEKTPFNFEEKEYVEVDREESPWAKGQAELDELWKKRLKLSVLNLKLAGKTVEEARKTLERRYKNQLNRVAQQNGQDVYETLINSFTTLYDPHTNYFSPRTSENFNINMSLQLEGIGAVLQTEDEHTKVVRLVAGGPADKQGQLRPADKIVGVGQGKNGEIVDVVGWRLDEVVDLIRGPKQTFVKLDILSGESESKVIEIQRGTVKLEDQAAQKAVLEVKDGDKVRKLGVIDIPAFYHDFNAYRRGDKNARSTTADVAQLLKELNDEGVEGVILDLRNNGGGSLQEATMLTDLFIDQGPVVQIRESNGRVSQHNRSRSRAAYRGPLLVLINRLSASASEIFAGAIQDYRRGIIVGSQSFGKGTVQVLSDLPEGQLKLTESKFYRVSGDSTQHRGVIPDVPLPVIINHEEVGESAYDNALPWDKITPAKHGVYFDFSNLIPTLSTLHRNRADKNPDIVHIIESVELAQKNRDKKTISLNEKERIKEKDDYELAQMQLENKRRAAKGEEVFKTVEAYKKFRDGDEEDEDKVPEPALAIDLEKDALLKEAGHILVDLMDLLKSGHNQRVANQ